MHTTSHGIRKDSRENPVMKNPVISTRGKIRGKKSFFYIVPAIPNVDHPDEVNKETTVKSDLY